MSFKLKTLIICTALMFVILLYIKPIEVEAIPSDQRTVLVKSWALPTSSTQDSGFAITSSFSGNEIYFVESNSNKIGRLVPQTNTITEWNIPSNSSDTSVGNNSGIQGNNNQVSSLGVDPTTGSVYFVESNSNKIGRLVPQTNTITEWNIQSNATNIQSMTLGFTGNEIYFVDSNSNKIGRLAPTTNLITEWNIPTANSLPTSIKFDPSTGTVYFVESNSNKIGRLVPFYNEFTEWNLQEKPYDIEIDSAGSIHYIDGNGTKMVRMD
jgi:virginiamycin B lyase